jgi:hypothetical protein
MGKNRALSIKNIIRARINKTKFLPASLLKKKEFPLFGIIFLSLDRQRGIRGDFHNNSLLN